MRSFQDHLLACQCAKGSSSKASKTSKLVLNRVKSRGLDTNPVAERKVIMLSPIAPPITYRKHLVPEAIALVIGRKPITMGRLPVPILMGKGLWLSLAATRSLFQSQVLWRLTALSLGPARVVSCTGAMFCSFNLVVPALGEDSSRDCSRLLPDIARCAVTTQYAGIPPMHGESLAQVCDGMFSTAGHASVDLACVVCYAVASCVVTPTRKVVWYRGVSKPAEEEASFAASPFVGVADCQMCGA